MIARIWHGWTTFRNASEYYEVLIDSVIPGIEQMDIPGFQKIDVLRRDLDTEVEFTTIMYFDSLENIKVFAGEDFETAHVPKEARDILKRWDSRSTHHQLLKSISQ
ncbi:MAG: hypothetical protein JJ971_07280 [Balneolaceae bacterium]|nr:hypothetical protein [Balneolaceae bacterium]MBO6546965.1 hypothetical protein [Balneolaceae bacterium]MBO6649325.1 hypothetical protein [Balneolaceae bacterium]